MSQQDALFRDGKSEKDGVLKRSRHQSIPSQALDLAPFPIDWDDLPRWYYMGGLLRAIGGEMGIPVRWLGDGDSDGQTKDTRFKDLGHVELIL